jgi:hypothetical protein
MVTACYGAKMSDDADTWREMIEGHLNGEFLVAVAPDESVLDVEFDGGFGIAKGPAFLAWTETRVFFPVVYDGAESVGAAPRNPTDEGQYHHGGQ